MCSNPQDAHPMRHNAMGPKERKPKVVAAIGGFDGVHKGHTLLLAQAKKAAQRLDLPLIVFTFSPLPKAVLNKGDFPGSLLNPENNEKEELLKAAGVDRVCTLKFNEELAQLSAIDFIKKYLASEYNIQDLFVGENFTFGAEGIGTPELLQKYFSKVTIVPLLKLPEAEGSGKTHLSIISSSAIREALLEGDVEKAEQYLGRPYTLSGTVVHGRGQGRMLGFSTANVTLSTGQLIPQTGVYAAEVTVCVSGASEGASKQASFLAAVNIGTAPTLGRATQPILEAHLLDFSDDLYGKTLTVALRKQLRREIRFSSVAELVHTVQLNVDQTRRILGGGK